MKLFPPYATAAMLSTLLFGLGVHAPLALADESSCQALVLPGQLADQVQEAADAFAETRLEAFRAATDTVHHMLPCMMAPLERPAAAALHRVQGLREFVDRNKDRSRQAFAAARALEPDYVFPEEVVPWGHPLLGEYQALDIESGGWQRVPPPAEGWVYVDGQPSEPRPEAWPAIVQVSDADGSIQASGYLWPDQPLPTYVTASSASSVDGAEVAAGANPKLPSPEPAPPVLPASRTTVKRGPSGWLVATAAGVAVTSGLCYFFASRSASDYWDPQTPFVELDASRARTNRLVVASGGLAAVATGAGVAAILSVQW